MSKKTILIAVILIAAIVSIYFIFFNGSGDDSGKFIFADVKRGDLSITITSTGAIQAVTTVDVGTQVSGRIDKILVDYNYSVKKGELLAILDTTNLALQVSNAATGLQKTQAQYDVTKATYERDKSLYDKKFISELDFITSKSNYETALANLNSAKSTLAQAKTNLGYAFIHSPINGTIINRNVQEGQTVAASLAAPTLFTIAEDLSQMQILADVDESDIGQIKKGQDVQFTVQAYPDKKFTGSVFQIRLGSTVISNVVNYIVVINAKNSEHMLLPGMTATVDFYVEHKPDVLMIPNAALRFQPSETAKETYLAKIKKDQGKLPDSLKNKFQAFNKNNTIQNRVNNSGNSGRKSRGTFWYTDENGNLSMGYAELGISDGKNTEIVRSRVLKDSMKVIVGSETGDENKTVPNRNILNPGQNMSRGIRRGF
ncbi:MAG TPA: efflux RND transporter periplasmic adaptor subunit [Ignavibacteriaceae bacterium]|nr:efflux RND transporter periplasmic adaptor subunit [Ignavibacteriaceae bacterium]